MDIKKQIDAIVGKVKADPDFANKFKENPEKAVESVSGIDIPDGMVDKVVEGVKAAIKGGKVTDAIDSIKKLF